MDAPFVPAPDEGLLDEGYTIIEGARIEHRMAQIEHSLYLRRGTEAGLVMNPSEDEYLAALNNRADTALDVYNSALRHFRYDSEAQADRAEAQEDLENFREHLARPRIREVERRVVERRVERRAGEINNVIGDYAVEELDNDQVCHICLGNLTTECTAPCTIVHPSCTCRPNTQIYGRECITTWFREHSTCPTCRNVLLTPMRQSRRPFLFDPGYPSMHNSMVDTRHAHDSVLAIRQRVMELTRMSPERERPANRSAASASTPVPGSNALPIWSEFATTSRVQQSPTSTGPGPPLSRDEIIASSRALLERGPTFPTFSELTAPLNREPYRDPELFPRSTPEAQSARPHRRVSDRILSTRGEHSPRQESSISGSRRQNILSRMTSSRVASLIPPQLRRQASSRQESGVRESPPPLIRRPPQWDRFDALFHDTERRHQRGPSISNDSSGSQEAQQTRMRMMNNLASVTLPDINPRSSRRVIRCRRLSPLPFAARRRQNQLLATEEPSTDEETTSPSSTGTGPAGHRTLRGVSMDLLPDNITTMPGVFAPPEARSSMHARTVPFVDDNIMQSEETRLPRGIPQHEVSYGPPHGVSALTTEAELETELVNLRARRDALFNRLRPETLGTDLSPHENVFTAELLRAYPRLPRTSRGIVPDHRTLNLYPPPESVQPNAAEPLQTRLGRAQAAAETRLGRARTGADEALASTSQNATSEIIQTRIENAEAAAERSRIAALEPIQSRMDRALQRAAGYTASENIQSRMDRALQRAANRITSEALQIRQDRPQAVADHSASETFQTDLDLMARTFQSAADFQTSTLQANDRLMASIHPHAQSETLQSPLLRAIAQRASTLQRAAENNALPTASQSVRRPRRSGMSSSLGHGMGASVDESFMDLTAPEWIQPPVYSRDLNDDEVQLESSSLGPSLRALVNEGYDDEFQPDHLTAILNNPVSPPPLTGRRPRAARSNSSRAGFSADNNPLGHPFP